MTAFELQGAPTGPVDAPAKLSPDQSWSPLERWIWEKLQAGEIANLDDYEDDDGRLPPVDPRKPEGWQDGRRRLAPRFLEDLLLREPYRNGLHRKGVRIRGAWLDDKIDLEWAEVTCQFWLDRCRFEQPVLLTGLRTRHIVSFGGSAFAVDLKLGLARISALLSLIGAKVASKLDMNSADIGQSLLMRSDRRVSQQRAEFDDVVLRGAKVARTLDVDSADIGRSLLMQSDCNVSEHRAEFNEVVLNGARVTGQVALVGAEVTGTLTMDAADIGQNLLMRSDRGVSEQRAEFKDVVLRGAKVRGQVDLRGAKVAGKAPDGLR